MNVGRCGGYLPSGLVSTPADSGTPRNMLLNSPVGVFHSIRSVMVVINLCKLLRAFEYVLYKKLKVQTVLRRSHAVALSLIEFPGETSQVYTPGTNTGFSSWNAILLRAPKWCRTIIYYYMHIYTYLLLESLLQLDLLRQFQTPLLTLHLAMCAW